MRDGERCAHQLETTWLPVYDVPATVARTVDRLAGVELSMDALAAADVETLRAGLAPLANGTVPGSTSRRPGFRPCRSRCGPPPSRPCSRPRRVADRIRAGIALLTDPGGATARRGVGRVPVRQRGDGVCSGAAPRSPGCATSRACPTPRRGCRSSSAAWRSASWRPFQLAFVLLNLPSLTDPAHPERAADHTAVVDLLFFPTGGGKTEAYLGLTAYTFAIRRLQGVVGAGADARSGARWRGGADALHAAAAHRPAVPAGRGADLRRRGAAPRVTAATLGGANRSGSACGSAVAVSPNWYNDAAEQIARGAGGRPTAAAPTCCRR